MSRLILIMIDGVGADHFERVRGRLPHLDRLAREGTQVAGVSPEMCATSAPGRTSIIAGVPPSEHGIYGNRIHAGDGFRWANPYDVATPTLPAADSQVGALLARLEDGGMRDQYNFAIVSDHGHADRPTGFYVDRGLDGDTVWSREGGVLMVEADSRARAREIEQRLTQHGIELWNNDHLPEGTGERMLTFVMPEDSAMSFESSRPGTTGVTGPSKYRSNHGMRPGTRADFRFCLFSGPDIPRQVLPAGEAMQVAPTLAKILGVAHPWQASPLF